MGSWDGEDYQQRFDRLEADGHEVHGEADLVATLHPRSLLDVGCGTGRVAVELARRGMHVVGMDPDDSMITAARHRAPQLRWIHSAMPGDPIDEQFDVVLMAGNVPLFTPAGARAALVSGCAAALAPLGRLVCGFQLGRGYTVEQLDEHAATAGLELVDRWSTWDREPFDSSSEYSVSVHQRPSTGRRDLSARIRT